MLTGIKVGPDVITINHGRSFMVSGVDATISRRAQQGLFTHDVRFLAHYQFLINGRRWKLLGSAPISHATARFQFTNPALVSAAGTIPRHTLGLTVERTIEGGVREELELVNYRGVPVQVTLEMELGVDFADLFEVRRNYPRIHRTITTRWDAGRQLLHAAYSRNGYRVAFRYQLEQKTSPARRDGYRLQLDLTLGPGQVWHTCAHLVPEVDGVVFPTPRRHHQADAEDDAENAPANGPRAAQWSNAVTRLHTSDENITTTLCQASEDLISLLMKSRGPDTPSVLAAGVPYFVALFGRDSLITGLQTLMLHRSFAHGALGALAAHQATESDDFRDADPGKILHELRIGELARFGQIPHSPYYGSADATLLYPILLHETYQWTGDRGLLGSYLPVAERCLEWMDRYGDRDGDGFQEYKTRSPRGIKHQGWKDSGDGVVDASGAQVEPPIALCELQGYAYDAKRRMADLYESLGDSARSARLSEEARVLRDRFNERFWLEGEGTYAFCLNQNKQPVTSVVSNPGHCLWSGIVPAERARRIVARLLADDMWSGWGIRTLSASNPAFNPFAYQRGAVWPHDNALIAAGCARYGYADAAAKIIRGIFDAALMFQGYRLPELFSGHAREALGFPVQYLGVNIPQAWAAGSSFLMMQVLLGIRADAPNGRLVVAPALPRWLSSIEVENLRVGQARVTLSCRRDGERSSVEVRKVEGPLTVVRERPTDARRPVS
jgi:glycogen debranching enzyme